MRSHCRALQLQGAAWQTLLKLAREYFPVRQLTTIATTIGPMCSTMNQAMSAVKVPFEEGEEENGVPPADRLGSEPCAVEWIINIKQAITTPVQLLVMEIG